LVSGRLGSKGVSPMVVGWVAKIGGRLLLVTIDTNLGNVRKKCNDSMLLMFCPDT
jgi:hypothetical protein